MKTTKQYSGMKRSLPGMWFLWGSIIAGTALAGELSVDNMTVYQRQAIYGSLEVGKSVTSPSTNGLQLLYAFSTNEISVIDDESGNGNTGTVYGSAVYSSGGKSGGAYEFDGSNDFIRVNSTFGIQGGSNCMASVSLWVKCSMLPDQGAFVMVGGIANGFAIGMGNSNYPSAYGFESPGDVLTVRYSDTGWIWSDYRFSDTHWHHVCLIIENGTPSIYVDGVQYDCVTGTTPTMPTTATFLGGHDSATNQYFTGLMDEIRIYNRALSGTEVVDLYLHDVVKDEAGQITAKSATFSDNFNQSNPNNTNVIMGKVGIGTNNPVTALQVAGTVTASAFAGDGSQLSNLNAGSISGGTLSVARMPAEVVTNSQLTSLANSMVSAVTTVSNTLTSQMSAYDQAVSNALWVLITNRESLALQVNGGNAMQTNFNVNGFGLINVTNINFPSQSTVTTNITQNSDIMSGIVFGMPFDSMTNYSDIYSNSLTVTKDGSPVWTNDVKVGTGSYKFAGYGQEFNVSYDAPEKLAASNMTISFWHQPISTSGQQFLMNRDGLAGGIRSWFIRYGYYVGKYEMILNGNAANVLITPSPCDTSALRHIVFTWNQNTYTLSAFINGIIVTNTTLNGLVLTTNCPLGVRVGSDQFTTPGSISALAGWMDFPMMYKRALSSNEVYDLYSQQLAGQTNYGSTTVNITTNTVAGTNINVAMLTAMDARIAGALTNPAQFATADQGLRADAALTNAAQFATADQGIKANTAYGWGNHAVAGYGMSTQVWAAQQYPGSLLTNGTRAMAANLDLGNHAITNVTTLSVKETTRLEGGVPYLKNLGDLSMGVYTNGQ